MYKPMNWLAPLLLAAAWPGAAAAQDPDWRTVTTLRQHTGEERLAVDLEYGAGELDIMPAEGDVLYRARLRYNAAAFDPIAEYEDGRLALGIEDGGDIELDENEEAHLELALGDDVPLDLELSFGAVDADLELGGLRVRELTLETGASDAIVSFSEPNPIRARLLEFKAGATAFQARGLGNANAERIRFEGGVGDITLDFTGRWRGDTEASIEMGMGALTLVLPRGLGVHIMEDTFLTSFDGDGLVERDGAYYSRNWSEAEHQLTVRIDAAFGSIDIRWVEGAR